MKFSVNRAELKKVTVSAGVAGVAFFLISLAVGLNAHSQNIFGDDASSAFIVALLSFGMSLAHRYYDGMEKPAFTDGTGMGNVPVVENMPRGLESGEIEPPHLLD